ncbi:MAG: EamA family transporter [Azospirillaceae bacterium]
MPLTDTLRILLVMMLFGLNFPISKIGVTEIPPVMFMALRFALVALVLLPWRPVPRQALGRLFALSLTLGVAHFSLMAIGIRAIDSSIAAISIQIQVPFSALLAALLFGDKLGWRRGLGMVIAIAGVAVLVGAPEEESPVWGVMMIIAAALLWAVANVQMKNMTDVDHITLNGWMALMAAPQLAVIALIIGDFQLDALLTASWEAYGAIVYNVLIVVVLCYSIWLVLLRRHPINLVMPWTLLVPMFGVAFSMLILGEALTWNRVVGGVATVIGVGIIVLRRPRLIEQRTTST